MTGYPYEQYGSQSNVSYTSINWSDLAASPVLLPDTQVYLIDRSLLTPRTYNWSLTLEQQLSQHVTLATSYVGNDGEKLIGSSVYVNSPDSQGNYPVSTNLVRPFGALFVTANTSHSNYQALQTQLTSRLGTRLSAIASYTYGHAEDNGSSDFASVGGYLRNPMANSSNDIRHIFASAIHYTPDGFGETRFLRGLTRGWAFDTIVRLETAAPLSVQVYNPEPNTINGYADVVPGVQLIVRDPTVPDGKRLNISAFASPPTDQNGNLLRDGTSSVNGYRLFGFTQWDVALSRSWVLSEPVSLAFRVDAFNVINVPNFANINTNWCDTCGTSFGEAQSTYATYFGSAVSAIPSGSQLSAFSNGGPRNLQLSLKLRF